MLLGTVVFNNSEKCSHTVALCCDCHTYCGDVDLGCDGCACKPESECLGGSYWCDVNDLASFDHKQSNLLFACTPPSAARANALTVLFTALTAKASSMAIDTAKNGSLRQKLLHGATMGASLLLLLFGILYSNHLSDADLDDNQRFKSIGRTLLGMTRPSASQLRSFTSGLTCTCTTRSTHPSWRNSGVPAQPPCTLTLLKDWMTAS
jgi:hypothetical protein